MFKKTIFNLVIVIILIMIGASIIKANKANKAKLNTPRIAPSSIEKPKSDLIPKEAKYYRVIEE